MDTESLLDHIGRLPRGRASQKQLIQELGARRGGREELARLLASLVESGRLIETQPGQYVLAEQQSEYIAGRLSLHRDGYGFVIPDQPASHPDIYINRESAAEAMHGDRVLARLVRLSPDGRAEGRIARVLTRAHREVVGQFRHHPRGNYVLPYDEKIREHIAIPPGAEQPPEQKHSHRLGAARQPKAGAAEQLDLAVVNVELTEFPSLTQSARGRVIEVLGRPGDFGVDVEIIIRKHHLPHRFPLEVMEEAEQAGAAVDASQAEGRRDFRALDVVTIDGETARDFDDAVWVERRQDGHFLLHVHIADVAHYVREGTALDREARLRGTSVYFPDRAVPMLPEQLSTGICSLNPGADRLVLSALLEINHKGQTVGREFCEGIIHSAERMTYTAVNLVRSGDPEMRQRYARLAPRLAVMADLAEILSRRRQRRGSIDFDLPEPVIEFDELGLMTGIFRAERNIAHRLIEEFMLTANEAVASMLEKQAPAALYRVHEKPDPRRVLEFEQLAAVWGHSLGFGPAPVREFSQTVRHRDHTKSRRGNLLPETDLPVTSQHYQKLIERIAGKPEERILSYLMLRSLKQARYSEKNLGHFALASPCYTHFTSPIRRYPDLVIHRLVKSVLRGSPASNTPTRLRAVAEECSLTERRAADAERGLMDWKKALFMEERLGEEFPAIVVSVGRPGLFVELLDLFIEGLVPIDTLSGDRYTYRESQRAIVGARTKKKFTLGDRLMVRVDRVEAAERRVLFSWAGEEGEPV